MTEYLPVEASPAPDVPAVGRRWPWAAAAAAVSLIPFLPGLTGSRVFYTRDLSLYFWGRYLWLRRAWYSGEWPLWDPFVGAGQAAYSDPLNQMFLPPAILVRLLGGEVLGFNLWVLLPYPLTAIGAWAFLARRFSAPAAALGAIAFGVCGPVVAGSNFPNFSWTVAGLPWILWATDRLLSSRAARDLAILAVTIALQCLAGEPVTVFSTLALTLGYVLAVGGREGGHSLRQGLRDALLFGLGAALGLALAAIQLIPMVAATRLAERAELISADVWSLRPTALVETVWLHLFGNHFTSQSFNEVPWMPLIYTGRDPFFFSIYFGVPLLSLSIFGLAGTGPRRWRLFWVAAGFVSLLASFGSYTPIYPILRDHVPPFGSFRFPVKYIVVAAMAIAAGAAAAWDMMSDTGAGRMGSADLRRSKRARIVAIGFALVVGALVALFTAATIYMPSQIGPWLQAFADRLGDRSGTAAGYLLRTARESAWPIVIVSLAAGLLMALTTSGRVSSTAARWALYCLIAGDLVVRAWGINPSFDAVHVAEPRWLSFTRADPDARFYIGGKFHGTLTSMDIDASRGFLNAPGLTGSASRAALSIQGAFYPSGWHAREMLSYDLPVLWPRSFRLTTERFVQSDVAARERFLDRTGVRYRVLPKRRAQGRTLLAPVAQFYESFLFDFGDGVAPRVSVVPGARLVPDVDEQIEALFEDGWDTRAIVIVDREPPVVGARGLPVARPFARFVEDGANRVVVEAGAGAGGGYLLMLDSYAADWDVTVDGLDATLVRANGLFRAVRLPEGTHMVEFAYKPRALIWGAIVSVAALVVAVWLFVRT
jgi:hypothetical protein